MAWIHDRETRLQLLFNTSRRLAPDATPPVVMPGLERFNFEWHIVPPIDAVPFDDAYIARLYSARSSDFDVRTVCPFSQREAVETNYRRCAGTFIAIEVTQKPHYLPGNRQAYGSVFGVDNCHDPFREYFSAAGFLRRSRYGNDYQAIIAFIELVNTDWKARGLLPIGYRFSICPPALFNLVGTAFHREWSETETLELGFHCGGNGSVFCLAVGSNAPGDFSFIKPIHAPSEWSLLGFRTALVPETASL